VTYAAPKSGDSAFAADYNRTIRDHTRFEFGDDIVPHLPPSVPLLTVLSTVTFLHQKLNDLQEFDYERVGSLMYIDRSFTIAPAIDDNLLPARRRSIANLILRGHVQQIADDHHAACKFGYMTALCPSGVCPPPLSTT
jgi:hypothetical protein